MEIPRHLKESVIQTRRLHEKLDSYIQTVMKKEDEPTVMVLLSALDSAMILTEDMVLTDDELKALHPEWGYKTRRERAVNKPDEVAF